MNKSIHLSEFDDADLDGVSLQHDDALVITLHIDTFQVKRILVDTGSSADIIFKDAFNHMGISDDRVKPISSPLYSFTGASVPVKGIAPSQSSQGKDLVKRSSYNEILERMGLNKLQAVASTYHLIMKFPTPAGVGFVKEDQILARRCYVASCKAEETLSIDDQRDEKALRRAEPVEALVSIPIVEGDEERHGAEQRYPNAEKLAFALLIAVRKLRPYFQSHKIIVLTDKPLRRILHKPNLSGRLVPWSIELGKFDIHYRPRPSIKGQALADFIVECTFPIEDEEPLLSIQPEQFAWTLFMDGSSNASGSAYEPVQNEETLRANLDLLNEQREQAAMRLAAYQHRVSKFYDQRVHPQIFHFVSRTAREKRARASTSRSPERKPIAVEFVATVIATEKP
ncbi:hypothetical protein RJ639_034096 [Escallonia herrerae]|uniref:Reverse transcriptase RNase H-like domain-containing protein n=1 Tax=Escallonia herrerae TaxID=1293975 RepID=A0AA89BF28_9ASTE|nr:hypothetical protein RJ639_034096 [Escallonia herrerae]